MPQFFREQDKPTIYTGYDPTSNQFTGGISGGEAEAQKLGVVPDWEAAWKPQGVATNIKTITPEDLAEPQAQIQLPETPPVTGEEADVAIAGATERQKAIQERVKETAPPETAESKRFEKLMGEVETLLPKRKGEGAAIVAGEEEKGVPGIETELADVSGQVDVKLAEYQQLNLQQQNQITAILDRPISTQHMQGGIQSIERQFSIKKNTLAAEIMILQAQESALQGQLNTARDQVKRAVDFKYQDIETEIENKMTLLELIRPELTEQENRFADAREELLDEEKQELEERKAREVEVEDVAISVAGKAPPEVIEQIQARAASGDVVGAHQLAAPYLQEEAELLSPTEAATLGVPYGTTKEQAAAMGITPARWKSDSGGGGVTMTDEEIRANIRDDMRTLEFKKGLSDEQKNAIYQQVLDGITTNDDLANKDRARLIASELFEVAPPSDAVGTTGAVSVTEENIASDFITEETQISGATFAPTTQQQQQQVKTTVQTTKQTKQAKEARERARQLAIKRGLVFYTDPTTGERVLTSQI